MQRERKNTMCHKNKTYGQQHQAIDKEKIPMCNGSKMHFPTQGATALKSWGRETHIFCWMQQDSFGGNQFFLLVYGLLLSTHSAEILVKLI